MGITYSEKDRVFKLDTPSTTYLMGIVDKDCYLGHIYYGRKIPDFMPGDMMRIKEAPFVPSVNNRERLSFYDTFPFEYPAAGMGDYRTPALEIKEEDGADGCMLRYMSHRIYKGHESIPGLPSLFGTEEDMTTLEITMMDLNIDLQVVLHYSVFEKLDIITRHTTVKNMGKKGITLKKVMSAAFDTEGTDHDIITLHGSWARERMIQRRRSGLGMYTVSSSRGETSHQDHCFIGIASEGASYDTGEVYGLHFVYSGNFIGCAEGSQFGSTRVMMGINPEHFEWKLGHDERFDSPEAVMTYSCEGFGKMSRTYHDAYREHLIRSRYRNVPRPVLINNWEATYFDFNTDRLLSIAESAKKAGIEMLVMDDGWFGHRSSDDSSLGDWKVNEEKLPGGLPYLVSEVNKIGLKFGIWMEPEMISPDSDLYKAHPDWVIRTGSHEPSLSRAQLVLDITRPEVREYVWNAIKNVMSSANIEYLKWDMNRQLADLPDGMISHKYVLALYELQERLISEFPDLLLENCSGGGARFDPGMLYFSPQIWCSDDTDAVERLKIQEGTALLYPLSTIGAHVSDCPNHTVGRVTPFDTRGIVALAGTFGYELDITKISEEDREKIPGQVYLYHRYNMLYSTGDYYRIASYAENNRFDAYMVVAKNRSEAIITYVQVTAEANMHSRRIKLKGLDENAVYAIEGTDEEGRSGASYMYAGLNIGGLWGDAQAKLIHLIRR